MTHIRITNQQFYRLELAPTDVIVVPDEYSVICADDWQLICSLAGGEEELVTSLGVTEVKDAL
jgi:hypothetical protein